MELYYQGVNITGKVDIKNAKCRDTSSGRADSLDITLDHALAWHRWEPQPDDRIEIVNGSYSTGALYVNTVGAENGAYRILATALKTSAARKTSRSYEKRRLEDILRISALECGMEYRIFGADEGIRYDYLCRNNEGCAAFLDRIAKREGAVLKTYSGRFLMIDILTAQALDPCETMNISANQSGVLYQKKESKLKSLTVKTPYASVTANDTSVSSGGEYTMCDLCAKDPATAGRWARGLLLGINRRAESLICETTFHAAWSAMVRVDITGETPANGQWIIEEVEHNFTDGTSKATLLRCIGGIR